MWVQRDDDGFGSQECWIEFRCDGIDNLIEDSMGHKMCCSITRCSTP